MNQTIFIAKIKEKEIFLFSVSDVRVLFGLSSSTASKLLHRYSAKKLIIKFKRGLYALSDAVPPEVYIANSLYRPSYLSREFALSFYGVIPETVYEYTSVTPKATRRFEREERIYSYRRIKKAVFTGYIMEKQGGFGFLIADPEKALIDASYFRMRDGISPFSRINKEKINEQKALSYAGLYNDKKLVILIQSLLQ